MGFIAGTATRSTGGTVPPGGAVGSVLTKRSLNNFDMGWDDVLPQTIADLVLLTADLGFTKVSRSGDQMTGDLRWPGSSGLGTLINNNQVRVDDGTNASVMISSAIYANMLQTPPDVGGLAFGVNFSEGGIYKSAGAGVVIRQSSNNDQIQIEPNNGSVRYSIIDERGGTLIGKLVLTPAQQTAANDAAYRGYVDTQDNLRVAKTGDTMTGLLTLSGPPTAPLHATTKAYVDANADATNRVLKAGDSMTGNLNFPNVGQGLTLAGGTAFYTTTSGNLGINAGMLSVNSNLTVTSNAQINGSLTANGGTIGNNGGLRTLGQGSNNVTNNGVNLCGSDGWQHVTFRDTRTGFYINPEARLTISLSCGGWGMQTLMWTNIGSPPAALFNGSVSATQFLTVSDSDLKDEITPVDPVGASEALDRLQPVRFKWKPIEIVDPETGAKHTVPRSDADRLYWGFVADDIKEIVPEAVYEDEEGLLSYDPTSILAVTVSQLQTLKQDVAQLKSRLR
jgi:phage baseplate assembly protein gpV